MGKTAEENSKSTFFTNVPDYWSNRKGVPLAMKVIVAYIYTRANIENMDWELVAADIANEWGIGKSTVSRVIKDLEKRGVIRHTETRKIKKDEWPSKIFKIDRQALQNLMDSKPDAVPPRNHTGSIVEPHQFHGGTAAVPSGNLEEELKEENNKKSTEEEGKTEIPLIYKIAGLMPSSKKSIEEQIDEIFVAVTSGINKNQDLSAHAASPSDNPAKTPQRMDAKEEGNDCSARPADNADKDNHPTPSARPGKLDGQTADTKQSAVDRLLNCPLKERLEWLEDIEADKTMERDLTAGKEVRMTAKFAEHFANL
jgi:SOS-response transcriptional repressor LexA